MFYLHFNKHYYYRKPFTILFLQINVSSNEGKKGLGCEVGNSTGVTLTSADKRKIATWQKTQARYQQTDIFGESDDSS